jgi:myb proto-oncogene protein
MHSLFGAYLLQTDSCNHTNHFDLKINTDMKLSDMIHLFRWHNHLNPGINKDAWTQEEEIKLIHAHQTYGNKWAELTKFLPGR